MRPTHAVVDLAAIRHNIGQIRAKIGPGNKLIAVVKANAYGHGAIKVGRAALQAGADCLAVAIPEEGVELRAAGLVAPIFVLGLVLPEQALLTVNHNLIAAVCTSEHLRAFSGAARLCGKKAQIMLKVDTGMGRIGEKPDNVAALLLKAQESQWLEPVGIFTHMAMADAADKTYAQYQMDTFKKAVNNIDLPYISVANSAAVVDLPDAHLKAVRPGIIIYGLPPSGEMHNSLELIPAMQFKSRIVHIKQVEANTAISYGCTYVTESRTYIATLPVGYADGYSRHLSNKAEVLIGGKRRPVVGRVCMDQLMVDLGPVCDAAVGDEAVLFGYQGDAEISVTELADMIGTINYELTCAVSRRVPRVYLNEE